MKAFFDCETNGLLPLLDTIHSLVVKTEDGAVASCSSNWKVPISLGIEWLKEADTIIGHNIIGYDCPALVKLGYPDLTYKALDTLNLSRLIIPEMLNWDMEHRYKELPKKLYGSHSLKAWGYRLGEYKGDFGETADWETWTPEMQTYCEQDVVVTEKLYNYLMSFKPAKLAVDIEMAVQIAISEQEREGVPFDYNKAMAMKGPIEDKLSQLKTEIQSCVPEHKKYTKFIPKRDNATLGYTKGVEIMKVKSSPFNPNSRQQILAYLKEKYVWVPTKKTKKGNPSLDAEALEDLGRAHPEVEQICRYLEAAKLGSQLFSGDKAWLKYVVNGRIHGRVTTNGALTGRATHSQPNLAQVPSVRAFMGKECRELFYAPEGYKIVGADASGLELRMLAHYLHWYDKGAYAKVILEGDVHTHNQLAAGLATRDEAKTFIYAFLYGCGPQKTGAQVHPEQPEYVQKIKGKAIQASFSHSIIGLRELKSAVSYKFKTTGQLRGIDGRIYKPRGEHSALNTLLQGAGATVCKYWVKKMWELIHSRRLYDYVRPALFVHDEVQLIVRQDRTEEIGELLVEAIRLTGEELNINMPLDGEYKVGRTWYDVH